MQKGKFLITALCLALTCSGTAGITSAAEKIHTNSIGMEFVRIPAGSVADPKFVRIYIAELE